MINEDRSNEAAVHFELYRLIKNNMYTVPNLGVRYESIEPERGVKTGSVDLVLWARKADRAIPFLALEVKRPSGRSYLLYKEESKKQIEGYARELQVQYSALTDGIVLRLFKLNHADGNYIHIGDYNIDLDDNKIRSFLAEMLKSYNNEGKPNITEAPSFSLDKFERELSGLTKTLRDVFEQLGLENGFSLEHISKPRYLEQKLSFNSFKGMLSLSIEREEKEISEDTSFILLELSNLRNKLGPENLRKLLVKLSQIECFKWIMPEKAEKNDEFTWKNLRDITIRRELRTAELEKQMKDWFLNIAELPKIAPPE